MAQGPMHDVWPWARLPVPDAVRPQPLTALPWLLAEALHLPFDMLRSHHALAVRVGLIRKSLLESGDFESMLDALEQAALGPYARRL